MNGMKLLKRHLAASSLAPLEAPRLPWGVLHPRQESEPAGGRQSRVVSWAALGVRAAMRRLSLQQNGSGGPGAVACC